jgi:hypothetical protein
MLSNPMMFLKILSKYEFIQSFLPKKKIFEQLFNLKEKQKFINFF